MRKMNAEESTETENGGKKDKNEGKYYKTVYWSILVIRIRHVLKSNVQLTIS